MPTRRSIAVHEAGHAVANFFHYRSVRYVTVKPSGRSLGHVAYRRPGDWSPTVGTAISHMETALAGYWAQREFGFRPELINWQSDREAAWDYALAIASPEEAVLWMRIAKLRAQRLVRVRRAEIEIVADRLMEADRIDMAELRELILSTVPKIPYHQQILE